MEQIGTLNGAIRKFAPVCNNYCKAEIGLPDRPAEQYPWVLVKLVDGAPIFDKGEEVVYIFRPATIYKGHRVVGEIAPLELMQGATEEDLADAKEWGLS